MWGSKARTQGKHNSTIHSLHWIEDSSVENDGSDCTAGGWLAFGGGNGALGVNWIGNGSTSDEKVGTTKDGSLYRSHFNLRGHTGGVKFVQWRPQGDRLVTYDSWGNVRMWKNRSNILALDFEYTVTTPVSDIQWSPCGSYVAMCSDEGQLHVISGNTGITIFAVHAISATVYGSHAEFTCLSWDHSSSRIALGTAKGEVIEVDTTSNGQFQSIMEMHENVPVRQVHYFGCASSNSSCEGVPSEIRDRGGNMTESLSLSLYMEDGEVAIFPTIMETHCTCVQTRIVQGICRWNSSDTVLAVVGYRANFGTSSSHLISRLLNTDAQILLSIEPLLPLPLLDGPGCFLTAICWGLQDSILLYSHGKHLYSFNVSQEMPSLVTLCREFITANIWTHPKQQLPLPQREILALDSVTPSLLPLPSFFGSQNLEHLFAPLPNHRRLHCVLVADEDTVETGVGGQQQQGHRYTMKYEHFGSYTPLLTSTKKSTSLQLIRYSIRPVKQSKILTTGRQELQLIQDGGSEWATSPLQTAAGCCSTSRQLESTTGTRSRLDRLKKTIYRLRSGGIVQDGGPLQEERDPPQPVGCGLNMKETDEHLQCPEIAEVQGNRLKNKFKVMELCCSPDSSEPPKQIAHVSINSHHISCEPRDLTISLEKGDESGKKVILTSKKPEWNSRFRVYELDFGGRINKDSVKNFQIEKDGEIIFQFGRTSFGDFSLDFQYPFSPVTALGVALSAIHSS